MMYDVRKKLPPADEDVLVVLDLIDGKEVCEAFRTKDNHWYVYKYGGRNNFTPWKVLEWMPMPRDDGFSGKLVSFGLGYTLGIVLALAGVLVMWY